MPPDVYALIEKSAEKHHRSLVGEIRYTFGGTVRTSKRATKK